ncbi:ribonuclease P protein component [Helicobacter aurati]|uniref:Ribonuclease P protein component n=1 Tax=Helicobacter aurati TaxID=137778 RepID=A0A3D8J5Z1_9HELI|nr:ribonuclease P protein component [Helicobacter aurati]RDU72883.1 ribonuclease P protein component [Helicobacter aurati]
MSYLDNKYQDSIQGNVISYLKNSFEFSLLFKEGMRINHECLCIYALSFKRFKYKVSHSKKYFRELDANILLGFSINRKVAKATKRNLLKRRIKAIIVDIGKKIRLQGLTFAFVCRKGVIEWDFYTLKTYITQTLHTIKKMFLQSARYKNTRRAQI